MLIIECFAHAGFQKFLLFCGSLFNNIVGEIGLLSFLDITECRLGFVASYDIEIIVSHLECKSHIFSEFYDKLFLFFWCISQDCSGEHRSDKGI